MPTTLKLIEGGAFADCPNLMEIEIPEGIEKIENTTFDKDSALNILSAKDTVGHQYAQKGGFKYQEIDSRIVNAVIETPPSIHTLTTGSKIDDTGLVLKITHENGIQKAITNGWGISRKEVENGAFSLYYGKLKILCPITVIPEKHKYTVIYQDENGIELSERKILEWVLETIKA